MSTLGWNIVSRNDERKARLAQTARALAAECIFNRDVLNDPIITLKGISDSSSIVKYPRLRTVGLKAAVASGLFLEDAPGSNIYQLLTITLEHIEEFNRILERKEDSILSQRLTSEAVQTIRSHLAESPYLKQMREEIQTFGDTIYNKYSLPKERDWTK